MVAGGTGGHIFPALALARELAQREVKVFWAGSAEGMEKDIVEKNGFEFCEIKTNSRRLKAKGKVLKKLFTLQYALFTMLNGFKVLDRINPQGIIATGSYAASGILFAGLLQRRSFFLLEQNRIPGRVTRFFAPFARESFLTFPPEGGFPGRYQMVGTPLREEILRVKREDDGKTVLVLGGSQGARALNLAGLDMAATLPNYHFIILTGRRDYQICKALIRSKNCELVEWTDHPEELYQKATIAVSRAGGLVISELLSLGIPAILVPYPYATSGHQEANARYLESLGAAIVLRENQLSGLVSLVQTLLGDEKRRKEMAMRAKAAARPDAAQVITERILQCLGV
ncbi:MAG: UDP-N-acetylglucosamine--N-acetylmuramyl-(pentapeptide) pyrophosphoryl-undecaprenol N-acetylglucosamine transferase [candidate division WOR-3 bacterium]